MAVFYMDSLQDYPGKHYLWDKPK